MIIIKPREEKCFSVSPSASSSANKVPGPSSRVHHFIHLFSRPPPPLRRTQHFRLQELLRHFDLFRCRLSALPAPEPNDARDYEDQMRHNPTN